MTASPSLTVGTDRARPRGSSDRGTAAARRVAGRYRHDRRGGTWTWSPEMAGLLGPAHADVRPCREILVRSLHREDRPRVLDALAAACTAAEPFALRVRLGGAGGDGRTAVLVGEPAVDVQALVRDVGPPCRPS